MRTTDFAPLYRSTVGFDHLFRLLDAMADGNESGGYPPYNIARTGDNAYEISVAVAGFSTSDLDVEVKENTLRIKGFKDENQSEQAYLHRGIAQRPFERRFQLADFIEVTGAELRDGMLRVSLVRNLPERMKPRQIEISVRTDNAKLESKGDKAVEATTADRVAA